MRRYHSETHYNLAGEYNRGREEANPELGYPALTLDEYCYLVDSFSQIARAFEYEPVTDAALDAMLHEMFHGAA